MMDPICWFVELVVWSFTHLYISVPLIGAVAGWAWWDEKKDAAQLSAAGRYSAANYNRVRYGAAATSYSPGPTSPGGRSRGVPIEVRGLRQGNSVAVTCPGTLSGRTPSDFVMAVERFAGEGCDRLYFVRGDSPYVDQIGSVLMQRGYAVTWVGDRGFDETGWLAIPR